MIVKIVDEINKDKIVRELMKDPIRNFFGLKLVSDPDKTKMFVAEKDSSIVGYLSIFTGLSTIIPPLAERLARIPFAVTLAAQENAVAEELLKLLPKNGEILLSFQSNLLDLITKRFPNAKPHVEYQMYLAKGRESLIVPNKAKPLGPEHSLILSKFSAESGRSMDEELCRRLLETQKVFGVFTEARLVSITMAVATNNLPKVWEVRRVFTLPDYRGKGFAKMVTSAATKEALKQGEFVTLFVNGDNFTAIRVYEKVGFDKIEWYSISLT